MAEKVAELIPGTKVIFEGGYGDSLYTFKGVILGFTNEWNTQMHCAVARTDMWNVHLETGSYASGYAEQFTIDKE